MPSGEVSLKLSLDVSAVTSYTTIGGISQPIIGQRKVEHEIRLKDGEVNFIGGIMESQQTKALSGIPGLAQIPTWPLDWDSWPWPSRPCWPSPWSWRLCCTRANRPRKSCCSTSCTSGPPTVVLLFGTVALLAPAFEELLFRGFLLPWLGQRLETRLGIRPGRLLAAVLTGLGFGLMHLQPLGWRPSPPWAWCWAWPTCAPATWSPPSWCMACGTAGCSC